MDPGTADLYRQEELVEETSAGVADVVGQAAARSDPLPAGGVLRAAVLRLLPWVPSRPWMSHRLRGDPTKVAWDGVVHRRRYYCLFRISGPFDHEIDTGRKELRRTVPAPY